jgi:hypothetical protein
MKKIKILIEIIATIAVFLPIIILLGTLLEFLGFKIQVILWLCEVLIYGILITIGTILE